MLPCAPRPKGEVVAWLSGSPKSTKFPISDVIAFEEPGHDPTNGVVLYDYQPGRGGTASEETCTLPAGQHALCTTILDDFLRQRWLMS
jgi:hypothetical protein